MKISDLEGRAVLDDTCPLPLDRPFTFREARQLGVSRRLLNALVDQGFLRRQLKNVYVAAHLGDSTRLRCQALGLVVPADAVIVDRHAAWLHGAPMALAPNEHVELHAIRVFRPSGHGRVRTDLADSGERNLTPSDVTEVNGLAVTTPLRTAWDLGRVRSADQAIAGIDAMLRLGVDHEELLDGVERFRGMRWVTTLRAMAPLGDWRSESPGESVLRLRWISAGLPRPQLQVEVWRDGVFVGRLDIADEDLRLAAEYDGAEWHTSEAQVTHDIERREELEAAGWQVRAFTAGNVFGRKQDAEQVLRASAREARQRLGRIVHT